MPSGAPTTPRHCTRCGARVAGWRVYCLDCGVEVQRAKWRRDKARARRERVVRRVDARLAAAYTRAYTGPAGVPLVDGVRDGACATGGGW